MSDKVWARQYDYLLGFRRLFKNEWPDDSTEYPGNNSLGKWCAEQRDNFHMNLLKPYQLKALFEISFPLIDEEEKWDIQLDYLKEYFDENNKFPSSDEQYPEGNFLGRWCNVQRLQKLHNELPDEEIKQLSELGFTWDLAE